MIVKTATILPHLDRFIFRSFLLLTQGMVHPGLVHHIFYKGNLINTRPLFDRTQKGYKQRMWTVWT